jgi:catechol 2,3-dioxygenase-like lactoylglutathione lyase family enzyme
VGLRLGRGAGSALGWQGLAAGDTEAVERVGSFLLAAGAESGRPGEYRSTVRKLGWQRIRRSTLSWSSKSIDFITLFTENLEQSKAFYQDVFGLRLIFEDENSAVFRFANTGINLLRTGAAGELIRPAAVASRDVGARLVFTIGVDDVDAVCAELAAHGVDLLNGPVNRPWGVRTASFADPGGHIWEIAQELSRADGS